MGFSLLVDDGLILQNSAGTYPFCRHVEALREKGGMAILMRNSQ
jgi:hypothetical protein